MRRASRVGFKGKGSGISLGYRTLGQKVNILVLKASKCLSAAVVS